MERVWSSRLRWRFRGATQWPAFALFVVGDGILLHLRPISAPGPDVFPALILSGFINLLVVAVAAPLSGRLVRRRRPDLPRAVAADYAGAALLALVAGALLVGGLLHRPAVERSERDVRVQGAAARAFLLERAPPAARARLRKADTIKLADRFYRTCVPDGRPRRAFCVFVRTAQDPPVVREDPDRSTNAEYRTVQP